MNIFNWPRLFFSCPSLSYIRVYDHDSWIRSKDHCCCFLPSFLPYLENLPWL